MSMCEITTLPQSFWITIRRGPSILRSIHDIIVGRQFLTHYDLPAISLDKVIEALTPPGATAGYDYQTLETVGDSFLKIATTIHVFLTYSTADEGRMSDLRMNSVDNQFLYNKALKLGLNCYVLGERLRSMTWIAPESDEGVVSADGETIRRTVGRKSLADTMEAMLGAALLTGGIDMALATGVRLGLCFGGEVKRSDRAQHSMDGIVKTAPNLVPIEERLGYTFSNGQLLLAAVTHRSYAAASVCYERLECLGDGKFVFLTSSSGLLIDLIMIQYSRHRLLRHSKIDRTISKSYTV
jgi:endoribonuclease Dicer